jgi:hypothetical protein
MPRSPSNSRRPDLRLRFALAGFAVGAACFAAAPAFAQAASCQEFGKTLTERRDLVEKLSSITNKKKQMDPKVACSMFGSLVANGSTAVKWLETNKEWCQIPDALIENIKQDHARALDFRGKACKAAAQQAAMEKKAKEGSSSGLLGGDGLTGSFKMPQGAL